MKFASTLTGLNNTIRPAVQDALRPPSRHLSRRAAGRPTRTRVYSVAKLLAAARPQVHDRVYRDYAFATKSTTCIRPSRVAVSGAHTDLPFARQLSPISTASLRVSNRRYFDDDWGSPPSPGSQRPHATHSRPPRPAPSHHRHQQDAGRARMSRSGSSSTSSITRCFTSSTGARRQRSPLLAHKSLSSRRRNATRLWTKRSMARSCRTRARAARHVPAPP